VEFDPAEGTGGMLVDVGHGGRVYTISGFLIVNVR
jgi:hypothetical protein